jgi:hypothetical protein
MPNSELPTAGNSWHAYRPIETFKLHVGHVMRALVANDGDIFTVRRDNDR